jgi:hypothetical protein
MTGCKSYPDVLSYQDRNILHAMGAAQRERPDAHAVNVITRRDDP